jgi:hypothetical protein
VRAVAIEASSRNPRRYGSHDGATAVGWVAKQLGVSGALALSLTCEPCNYQEPLTYRIISLRLVLNRATKMEHLPCRQAREAGGRCFIFDRKKRELDFAVVLSSLVL